MMENIEKTIKVKITNLIVHKYYYSFDWEIKYNGTIKNGNYESSHSYICKYELQKFRGILKNGYAISLAVGNYFA